VVVPHVSIVPSQTMSQLAPVHVHSTFVAHCTVQTVSTGQV
jgi:hypothetical protein